jgi:hypothetical protein
LNGKNTLQAAQTMFHGFFAAFFPLNDFGPAETLFFSGRALFLPVKHCFNPPSPVFCRQTLCFSSSGLFFLPKHCSTPSNIEKAAAPGDGG